MKITMPNGIILENCTVADFLTITSNLKTEETFVSSVPEKKSVVVEPSALSAEKSVVEPKKKKPIGDNDGRKTPKHRQMMADNRDRHSIGKSNVLKMLAREGAELIDHKVLGVKQAAAIRLANGNIITALMGKPPTHEIEVKEIFAKNPTIARYYTCDEIGDVGVLLRDNC